MSRKVFLSFLGTNEYVPCHYYDEGTRNRSELSKYVQTAIIELYTQEFNNESKFFFFLTKDAKKMNWFNDGQYNHETQEYDKKNVGLLEELKRTKVHESQIFPKSIPEGFSSEQIWEIFDIVRDCIEENDEIFLDITHAFRSIPMLGMALLNYLKIVKNIKVKGIYYGAFEKLGRAADVKKMEENERNAPIINLLTLSELQDWTLAANSFVKYGKTDSLINLAEQPIIEYARFFKGEEGTFNVFRKVFKSLNDFSGFIETNRGIELNRFKFRRLKGNIDEIKDSGKIYISAYQAILETINKRIVEFNEDDPLNFIRIVEWSRENGMLQQAITQLKEGITTYFAKKHKRDYISEDVRSNIEKAIFSLKDDKLTHKNYLFENPLKYDDEAEKIAEEFKNFCLFVRNDINHNGIRQDSSKAEKLKNQFDSFLALVKDSLNFKGVFHVEIKVPMLLNLTNHPSSSWSSEQKEAAIAKYQSIQDMPFPQIDPSVNEEELNNLVDEYFEKIQNVHPQAVHIMGEMTFTYRLVQRLKTYGYTCIASTTQREVITDNDGNKVSKFNFVQFRSY